MPARMQPPNPTWPCVSSSSKRRMRCVPVASPPPPSHSNLGIKDAPCLPPPTGVHERDAPVRALAFSRCL